jgi:hypothetical protein
VSYFDHVQCHTCGARMDPEKLVPGQGEGPACPYCGAALNLADLFGVKDSFVGHDDGEGNAHSLDDLVGGQLYDARYPDGYPPPPVQPSRASRPAGAGPARPTASSTAPRPAAPAGKAPARPALPGPTTATRPPAAPPGSTAMVPRPKPADDTPAPPPARRKPGAKPSALDLLRDMKKKK